jgi:predicted nucleic acid-binding protein
VVDLRVFADTNTLYPFYVCDLLLHCAEEDLFEILWSEDLFTELIKVIPQSGRKSVPMVERMCAAIREAFPDGEIPRKAYEHLISQMPGPDPDDHVHSAAAIGGYANILLTRDTRGFPPAALRRRGLRVTTADQFLCEQFMLFPDDLVRVLDNQAADLTRSRPTRDELLNHLGHQSGAPRFAQRVRRYLRR